MGDDGVVTPAPRSLHALAGLVAGLMALAVGHALALVLGVRVSPVSAVAEGIIALTPGPVAETLIGLVGRYDKPILVAGVVVGVLAIAAATGLLARRSQGLAVLVAVATGALGALAAWTRPDAGPYDVLPAAVGTVVWVVALGVLSDRLARHLRDAPESAEADAGRRRFLMEAAVVAAAAVVVGTAGQLFGAGRRGVESVRRLLRLPVTSGAVPDGAQPAGPPVAAWRTPNPEFYRIDTALVVPAIDPTEWRLRVHGLVERELELSYRELVDRELTEGWVTLCCVSNEVGGDLVGNAWWSGVRVADLLAEAGVQPGADAVLQTSQDGWTCGTPLEVLTDDRNALLAVAMNGEPLPLEHGFPVRAVVPGLYGYVSATKWLVDLEVTRFADITAYWTERGWSERGPVKTQSRIDVPRGGASVEAGSVRIGGVAWAQHTGIERVEYRLDGTRWTEATLGRVPNVDTWVQWSGTIEVGPGRHTLGVRATDRSGYTQTSVRTDVVPDGATGWHVVEFEAR